MSPGWRSFRPAIWLAMLGVALALMVSPPYIGAVLIGAAIGVALRIQQRRNVREARRARGSRGSRRSRGGTRKR